MSMPCIHLRCFEKFIDPTDIKIRISVHLVGRRTHFCILNIFTLLANNSKYYSRDSFQHEVIEYVDFYFAEKRVY